MLKVRYDLERQDFLDYLQPFVAQALPSIGERIESARVADAIHSGFGLDVPVVVVERVLRRLSKRGSLEAIDGALYVKADLRDKSLSARRDIATEQIRHVIARFSEFCAHEFSRQLDSNEATIAIVGFVRKFAVDCLRSFVFRSPIPDVPSSRTTDFWVAKFLSTSAKEENGDLWPKIVTLFESVLLANAFVCPDADLPTATFHDVSFYLDTPLALSLLGAQGEYEQRKAAELLKLVGQLKGHCYVFQHTVEEARAVLHYVEQRLFDLSATNRAIRCFRETNSSPSDVALLSATIEPRLKALGVPVRPTPPYDQHYQIDENALEGCLEEDLHYANPKAVLYDINSIRAIYVLRKGIAPSRLEQCGVVFVTPNASMAHAAFMYSRQFEMTREVSPAITDFALANLCWLKNPKASETLAQLELLAASVSALRPSFDQWQACLSECEKLRLSGKITSDQETIVRGSIAAQDDLAALTIGSETEFGPKVALEIVRRAEERIAKAFRDESELVLSRLSGVEQELSMERQAQVVLAADRAKKRLRVAAFGAGLFEGVALLALMVGTFVAIRAAVLGVAFVEYGFLLSFLAAAGSVALGAMTWWGWSRRSLSASLTAMIDGALVKLFGE